LISLPSPSSLLPLPRLFFRALFYSSGGANDSGQTISYNAERIIGNGSFGVVFQATVEGTGEVVAIKKVMIRSVIS